MLSRAGHLEYDRVLFFSDAIFAIAITLLVLEIRLPSHPGNPANELHAALPHIFSFGISFVVIGLFWMGHHSLSRYIAAFDRGLIAINLLFLGLIAFLPYPTGLLNTRGNGSLSWVTTAFYATCIAAAGLAELAIWLYARGKDLLTSAATPALRREVTLRLLISPVVFLLSIPVSLYSPDLATYCWLFIVVGNHLLSRSAKAQQQAS
jgi:uncharacterized membrane protein